MPESRLRSHSVESRESTERVGWQTRPAGAGATRCVGRRGMTRTHRTCGPCGLWLLFILIAFYGQTIRIRSFPAATYGDNLASSEGRLDFDQSLHLDGRVQRQRVGADGTACVIAAVLEDRHHHVRAAVEHEVLLLKFLL